MRIMQYYPALKNEILTYAARGWTSDTKGQILYYFTYTRHRE